MYETHHLTVYIVLSNNKKPNQTRFEIWQQKQIFWYHSYLQPLVEAEKNLTQTQPANHQMHDHLVLPFWQYDQPYPANMNSALILHQ